MLPVIALVGRPNVGKSTLFNRLTRTRDALVADQPGLTRDRNYGVGRIGDGPYVVVDTGGLVGGGEGLESLMERQAMQAVEEADHVLFLLDGRAGLAASDQAIAGYLRRTGKPVTAVVNKSEGLDGELAVAEFHALGLGPPVAISASHGRGVADLMQDVLVAVGEREDEPVPASAAGGTLIAVVGRPNVGKSTLVNRLLGEERVLAFDQPGTTRDSIFIPFARDGRQYTLIDTAGVRRRGRVSEAIEKFSVIKTLRAIDQAHVVLLVLDGREGVGEQDATLAGHVLEAGRALVLVINKWDGLDNYQRDRVRRDIELKLPFLDFARRHFVSALHGSGVGELYASVDQAHSNANCRFNTHRLTTALEQAVQAHAPPMAHGRRIKLRYAHQGGQNPPLIIIHGNQTEAVPADYRRYLINSFRRVLDLTGTPLRIEFKSGENPFQGRKNVLTPRQQEKRQRLKRFTSRGR